MKAKQDYCDICGKEKSKLIECHCGKYVCVDCYDKGVCLCKQCEREWAEYWDVE